MGAARRSRLRRDCLPIAIRSVPESCNRCCSFRDNGRVPPQRTSWVLLAYRLPRDPSTPRSALWRKLRRLGATQLLGGLTALTLDGRNREQQESPAQKDSTEDRDATT